VIRPTALIILPLLLVFNTRKWRLRAVMAACTLAVIVPVTIANWRVSQTFIPVQAFGGMNLYLGNSPLRDGLASARPGGDWDRIEPEAARHGAASPLDDDRYFVRKTRAEIAQHPLAYARVVLRKLAWTFQNDELRDTHSFYFFRRSAPLLWLPSFAILFGLAAAGAFVANWRDRGPRLLTGYIALTALTTVALVIASRYRMPMILGLAPFAGLAVDRMLRRPERRQLMAMAAIAIVAAALTFVWHDASTHNPAEELALTAESLTSEGKDAEAEATARNAVEADPENALAHDALGMALAARGRPLNARTALQRATNINPDFAAARIHLGHLYEQLDDVDGATNAYEHAIAIDPRDPRPLRPLAAIETRRGNIARAIELTSRLAAFAPDSGTWLDLARLQGAAGKPEAGLESARRAMALREPEPAEWLLVANLATDAHQFDAAQQAVDRAQAAGAPPAAVSFASALLRFREGKLDEAAQIANQLAAQQPGFQEARQLQAAIENARHPR
jgi:Flp pilus assembly protein TadD